MFDYIEKQSHFYLIKLAKQTIYPNLSNRQVSNDLGLGVHVDCHVVKLHLVSTL